MRPEEIDASLWTTGTFTQTGQSGVMSGCWDNTLGQVIGEKYCMIMIKPCSSVQECQQYGWNVQRPPTVDWDRLRSTVQEYIKRLNFGYKSGLRSARVEVGQIFYDQIVILRIRVLDSSLLVSKYSWRA